MKPTRILFDQTNVFIWFQFNVKDLNMITVTYKWNIVKTIFFFWQDRKSYSEA